MQGMVLADLRDQLDLHGIGQAQQYLQEGLNGNGSAPVKRLIATDTSFREARGHLNPDLCFYARISQKTHMEVYAAQYVQHLGICICADYAFPTCRVLRCGSPNTCYEQQSPI